MCIVFTLCFNIFPWKQSRDFMWSFCIYCILHAKFPIPEITTPYAAMHQFPEKLNCLAIVQEFITPPLTVSRIKMTGCPLRRYPRDLVSPDRGGRQLRILPRHPQSPWPGEQSTLPVIYLYLGEVMNATETFPAAGRVGDPVGGDGVLLALVPGVCPPASLQVTRQLPVPTASLHI